MVKKVIGNASVEWEARVHQCRRLRFDEPAESEFQHDYFRKTLNATRNAWLGGLLIWLAFGVLDYWMLPQNWPMAWAIRFGIASPYYLLMIALSFVPRLRSLFQFFVTSTMFVCGFSIVLMIIASNQDEPARNAYFAGIILVHIGGYVFLNLRFWAAAFGNLMILASYEVAFLLLGDGVNTYDSRIQFLSTNFFLIGANILGLWSCYLLEYFARRDFALRKVVESEQEESDRLLLNILPREIAEELKTEQRTVAHSFDEASILFADVVGFTPMTAEMAADELIGLLNEVFSYFDSLVEKHRVEKIKTIGDCYMAAAGVPVYRPDHAQALARMALEIAEYVECHTFGGRKLRFRIGINSGPVIAGVIGQMKFSYDLWGDTVNTASRMESQGQEGCIQITRATYEILKDSFICEPRGVIDVKGKGQVEVWHIRDLHADDPEVVRGPNVTPGN